MPAWLSQDSRGGRGVLRDHLTLTPLWLVQAEKSSLEKDVFVVDFWRLTLNFLNLQLLVFCNPFSLGNLENTEK